MEFLLYDAGPARCPSEDRRPISAADGLGRKPSTLLCSNRDQQGHHRPPTQRAGDLPEHPLKKFMMPKDTPKTAPPGKEHTLVGVYVNGFILGLVEMRTGFPSASIPSNLACNTYQLRS